MNCWAATTAWRRSRRRWPRATSSTAYKDVRLAKASSLNRAVYERYSTATRKARPDQIAGLISHAEFLKTGGRAPAGPFANPRPANVAAFAPTGTRIALPAPVSYTHLTLP